MIAVLAESEEHLAVREFFELFKTPWEFYRNDAEHPVLICAGGQCPPNSAKLVLIYDSEETPFDGSMDIQILSQCSGAMLSDGEGRFPIYGNCVAFKAPGTAVLTNESTRQPVAMAITADGRTVVRLGFDLFREVRHLLTRGQPAAHASIPTLEMHIALLRNLIVGCSIPLIEIPPVPDGYNFIACLTHDADHVGVRRHKFDHTMFGFLYRATLGSLIGVLRGRKSVKQLAVNLKAALSLPFVHLGWARDFWYQFERYLEIEKGLNSTFFVIPVKGEPGRNADGSAPAKRAAHYDIGEIGDHLRAVHSAGREIGLHGIDAWRDCAKGREERECISSLTHSPEVGVRIHWLYFDEQSPAVLEAAGFSYDSTIGYNETVGYRAGTTQAFKPFPAAKLIELPMHVMDTALFYPCYLDLSPKDAEKVVRGLVENALQFGGVMTVNWHDRSIAPERLWDGFYIKLLEELKGKGAWFSSAIQAVSWFRKRRSAVIQQAALKNGKVDIKITMDADESLPGLKIRVHQPSGHLLANGFPLNRLAGRFTDVPFNRNIELSVAV